VKPHERFISQEGETEISQCFDCKKDWSGANGCDGYGENRPDAYLENRRKCPKFEQEK